MNAWIRNDLTPAQKTYISDLASGFSVKESALARNVSKHTVRNTISQAKERVGAITTINLVAMAISKGWIEAVTHEPPFRFNPNI